MRAGVEHDLIVVGQRFVGIDDLAVHRTERRHRTALAVGIEPAQLALVGEPDRRGLRHHSEAIQIHHEIRWHDGLYRFTVDETGHDLGPVAPRDVRQGRFFLRGIGPKVWKHGVRHVGSTKELLDSRNHGHGDLL